MALGGLVNQEQFNPLDLIAYSFGLLLNTALLMVRIAGHLSGPFQWLASLRADHLPLQIFARDFRSPCT